MHTLSGRRFDLGSTFAPSIPDVAIGLSRIPRWAGSTVRPWSVLQHSLAARQLAGLLDEHSQLYALWHDSEEMATGDIPSPFKAPEQRELGRTLRIWLFRQTLGLPYPSEGIQAVVKEIDDRLKIAEAHCLCHPLTRESFCDPWDLEAVDAVWHLIGMPEREAIATFIELTMELK